MARQRFEMGQFVQDPFATLRAARAAGAVVDLALVSAGVPHHDHVRQLLSDDRLKINFAEFLRTVGVSSGPFYEWISISPLNHDGTNHQRWRGLMSRTFTPRRVEGLRPFLRSAAHELIDAFAGRG